MKDKHKFEARGFFDKQTLLEKVRPINLSMSTLGDYIEEKKRNKKINGVLSSTGLTNWGTFALAFKRSYQTLPIFGELEPIKDETLSSNTKMQASLIGEHNEIKLIEKVNKEYPELKDKIKVNKERFFSQTYKVKDTPFISTEIDGYVGKSIFDAEAIVECKITKETLEKTKIQYDPQFQGLMWFFNVDYLWLLHHDKEANKVNVVKIKKDKKYEEKIIKSFNKIQDLIERFLG